MVKFNSNSLQARSPTTTVNFQCSNPLGLKPWAEFLLRVAWIPHNAAIVYNVAINFVVQQTIRLG